MKYTSLTDAQKLALTPEDFLVAVKIEAIERGVKPPITLANALKQSEAQGFSMPPDAVFFYEILAPTSYDNKPSGIVFRTAEEAQRAIVGAYGLYEEGYGATAKNKLANPEKFSIRQVWISGASPKQYWTRLEEYMQDDKAFDEICDECRTDLQAIRQREYDKAVRARKRKEYLALARGSLEIAQAFWAKTEPGDFPEDTDPGAQPA